MVKRGLIIGRFQPFHIGHLKGIQDVMKKIDELIILIGSAQYSHSFNNPFTAGERIMMLHAVMIEHKIDLNKVYIIPLIDTNDNRIWVSHLITSVPKFDVAFTHNPLVKRLFFESKVEVQSTELWERNIYSATEVRRRMLANENWEELVPKCVAAIIREISGIERIQQINDTTLKQ